MPVWAVATTPRPMVRWPATPTWPASVTSSSMGAAGHADLRREQHVAPHRHAVGDLHEVVDLGAGADAGLPDRRPVDRRIRADLHVVLDDEPADLRDLLVRAVGAPGEAEAVAAHDRAVLDHHAVADDDPLAHGDVRVQHAVVADARARTDHDEGMEDRRAPIDHPPPPPRTARRGRRGRPTRRPPPPPAARYRARAAASRRTAARPRRTPGTGAGCAASRKPRPARPRRGSPRRRASPATPRRSAG